MVRRSVAAGAGVIVFILLAFAVKGCLDSRKEQAFKDYVRDVSALIGESDRQGDNLFVLLGNPADAGSEVEVQNQLNAFRNESDRLVDRAEGTEHPDDLKGAHSFLVETLAFRRDGVATIADQVPNVLADQGDRAESTRLIASAMQNFLTSDVIYQTRVVPALERTLKAEQLTGEVEVRPSQFLADIDFLQPDVVADRIAGGGTASGEAAPGLHGNGLVSASLGGQALTPDAPASITLSDDLAFEVQVANQGENTETDVQVNVTVGSGGDEIQADKVLDEIAAGETKAVEVPLTEQPATGQTVPINVEIEAVPGEEKTDNNAGEFSAIFTR